MSSKREFLLFVDNEREPEVEVRVPFRELTTKPLPAFWRSFITQHFQKNPSKRYTFERDKIRTNELFSEFFDKILSQQEHVITECLHITYKEHFEQTFLMGGADKNPVSDVREFVTFFSLFIAKEWGISLAFFSIVYRKIAINLVNVLFPLLIGLYICKPRNQELSVILHKLETSNIGLDELGLPKHFCKLDYSPSWKILKKLARCQDIISQVEVLNYFYYNIFVCIDLQVGKKRKVKDVDLTKVILYCLLKAQVTNQNIHCIINLIYDFSHGLVSEKDFSVIQIIHNVFSWIKSSVKVERESDFQRYHKRTVVTSKEPTKPREQLTDAELHRQRVRAKREGSIIGVPGEGGGAIVEEEEEDVIPSSSKSSFAEELKKKQMEKLKSKEENISKRPNQYPSTNPLLEMRRGGGGSDNRPSSVSSSGSSHSESGKRDSNSSGKFVNRLSSSSIRSQDSPTSSPISPIPSQEDLKSSMKPPVVKDEPTPVVEEPLEELMEEEPLEEELPPEIPVKPNQKPVKPPRKPIGKPSGKPSNLPQVDGGGSAPRSPSSPGRPPRKRGGSGRLASPGGRGAPSAPFRKRPLRGGRSGSGRGGRGARGVRRVRRGRGLRGRPGRRPPGKPAAGKSDGD